MGEVVGEPGGVVGGDGGDDDGARGVGWDGGVGREVVVAVVRDSEWGVEDVGERLEGVV